MKHESRQYIVETQPHEFALGGPHGTCFVRGIGIDLHDQVMDALMEKGEIKLENVTFRWPD